MSLRKNQKLTNIVSIFIILFISVFNFMDRALLPPNYNLIMLEFGKTEPEVGLISTLFMITAAICTVIFGFLNDRVNRKWLLFGGSIYYSISSLFVGYAQSYEQLLLFKILTGVGIGVVVPVAYSIITDMFKATARSRVFSVFGVALTLGGALGTIISGNYGEAGNWRTPFILIGIINIVAAVSVIFLNNPKRGAKEEILESKLQEGLEYSYKIKMNDLKYIYTRKSNFFLIINFIDNIPGGIIAAWAITWLVEERGVPKDVASTLFLIASAFSLVGSIVGGIIGDRWFKKDKRARVGISMFAMIFEVPFLIAFVLIQFNFTGTPTMGEVLGNSMFLISIIMVGLFFFIDSFIGPNWYSTIMDVNLPEHRGTMLSVANLVDAVGAGIGPWIGGLLYLWLGSYQLAFILASVINIAGFILWIPMFRNIRKDIQDVENILKKRVEEPEIAK
ncbi:MAG: MFS transporter [Promethearchaeota archaeon]|nr:MAG: MFS transporter [Candidatus Lokiarchaeota archaeon]